MINLKALSSLTYQERISSQFKYDLGPAYPQFESLAEWRLLRDDALLSDNLQSYFSNGKFNEVSICPEIQFAKFLDYREEQLVNCVLTGSLALNRALAALIEQFKENNVNKTRVVTTSPCIDIIRAMALEQTGTPPIPVSYGINGDFSISDAKVIVDKVQTLINEDPDVGAIVMLTSPENPTGRIWTNHCIEYILTQLNCNRVALIFDHCFMFSGKYPNKESLSPDSCAIVSTFILLLSNHC
ncbi:aminotransferase class I/II-fold pyridoxal phosphate-dependent enzyme [Pseudoalteromonas sp. NJ631]|uniref:aminotransferase class I/II-fold pyridoxal phosphate-dependent enzyme n=1 Tax=Pseudoalteromonas sp. NJ631 TaxID=493915 RepID=UPI000303B1FC|nr:aminotransferase class I/II-fold pyridoxal phosphate-dependent enzyme [Pseudoalteromonas sp. NJ631]